MDNRWKHQWTKEEVATALGRNEFVPFFQPKIDLTTDIASCVEILARWDHPVLGILPPSEFIKQVESAGLIDQLTDNLLRQSLVTARNSAATGRELGIAVNFSLLTLQDPKTPYRICSLLEEYDVSFDRITIEVTESATSENLSSVFKSLTTLRSQGFRISIDDFGTGYSSLKLLSKMPFTELKIDRMFISRILENKKLTDILESIVHLAKKLDLSTVAEGIETKTQLDFVRQLGCNAGQGFYFGAAVRHLELNRQSCTVP
jgi:EAL domain-containing protein (putative c-di-GMP-specific phosphodiesterase class I)